MVSQHPIRTVIIGYGLAGAVFHAPLVAATPGMEVSAIVTNNRDRQRRAQKDYPKAEIISHVEKIWDYPERYDLVVVATANRAHVPLAIAAMEAGLPVVVDKPMAPSIADAERLIATSQHTGKMLTVFQNRRWDNDFLTVKRLMETDVLGPITRYESRYERYRLQRRQVWRESGDPVDAGGLLFDIGSHLIDQALQLFGQPVRVYAEIMKRRNGAVVDDDTFVALEFSQQVVAHLWMSLVAPKSGARVRVCGLRGTYEKWGLDPQEEALRSGILPGGSDWGKEERERWGSLTTEIEGIQMHAKVETEAGAYPKFYELVRAALTDDQPVPVDPRDALNSLRVITAAQRSAQEGIVVPL